MIPYGRQSVSEKDIEAVVAVLRGEWLTTGPAVEAFESAIKQVSGTEHAVSVTSGTAALHVAYSALNLKKDDEVITTPLTFVATAATAAVEGARIRFADIDPVTGNLDPLAASEYLNDRTKAITTVDYAGVPADIQAFRAVVGSSGPAIIQDAAHSIGSTFAGRPVGSEADLTTFSFFPTKNLTTAEGGAVVTNDENLAFASRQFKNHGLVREQDHLREPDIGPWHQEVHRFGLNYRLPDVLAALGLSQIQRLGEFKSKRRRVFDFYSEALSDVHGLELPNRPPDTDPLWHLFPIRVEASRRRLIFERLRELGIGVQVNYIPAYWHPVFQDLGYKRGMCPNAERFYAEEISLPMYADLTPQQLEQIAVAVKKVVQVG